MNSLHLVDNFVAQFNFVVAFTEAQRREAYSLRFKQLKVFSPRYTHLEQVIDQFDRESTHLLMQEKQSGKNIATIRISKAVASSSLHTELPCQNASTQSLSFIQQIINSGSQLILSEISMLSIAPDHCINDAEKQRITEAMYLAAFSLARLRFDDRILLSLSYKHFKRLRASGLQLEHTTSNPSEQDENLFWLSCESGIQKNSPAYDVYQHILGYIAHQMNQPQLEMDEYNIQQSQ